MNRGRSPWRPEDRPPFRRLRVFAIDPEVAREYASAELNTLTLNLLWEVDRDGVDLLGPGPVGEYLEVIDSDLERGTIYPPVDLNDPEILSQEGLSPQEGDRHFHQQMVYAVAMATIDRFERVLGRVALWAPGPFWGMGQRGRGPRFVRRLRVYPHAFRGANAYYDSEKKSLLFGYFPNGVRGSETRGRAGKTVYTCLSHDVIAHETTHALLEGLHPRFNEATNPDVDALHEGFADIVSLFQRFSHAEVLKHQIARTGGDLERPNLLGQFAQQVGRAMGHRGALRDAIGGIDAGGEWRRRRPDPALLASAREEHGRGAVLVAAVFDAFLAIYRLRSADLMRIASNGTGVLPAGTLHPDLVSRLAREASAAAEGVLRMCIRGLDYVPPVDVTFGDYLRAIITADYDHHLEDEYGYRDAFIEAFCEWGIWTGGIAGATVAGLQYPRVDHDRGPAGEGDDEAAVRRGREALRANERATRKLFDGFRSRGGGTRSRSARRPEWVADRDYAPDADPEIDRLILDWDLRADRETVSRNMEKNCRLIHRWLTQGELRPHLNRFGLTIDPGAPPSVFRTYDKVTPAIEVHSVRTAVRQGLREEMLREVVVEIHQRRRGYFDPRVQEAIDSGERKILSKDSGDFRFRRGCTLIIDHATSRIRYAIHTRGDIAGNEELDRVRKYLVARAAQGIEKFTSSAD